MMHDALAVIANEVMQSSKTKTHCRHCERSEAIQQDKDAFFNHLDCRVG
jgi:L-lysine 2,3-aminomutase